MPKPLSKSGAITLRKLTFYDASKSSEPQNKLIYFLKRNKNRRIVEYCAQNLAKLVREELDILELSNDNVFVLGVPRSKKAIAKHGHDQSALIAKALAKEIGARYLPIIKRRIGGKEQKKLTAAGRVKNVKTLFERIPEKTGNQYKGKSAILIDDVATTGASMAAVTDLLRRGGVKNTVCVCLSATPEKIEKKNKKI